MTSPGVVERVSPWRIGAGALVLAALVFFAVRLLPVYYRNYQLHQFVAETTRRVETKTASDDVLRTEVVDRARALSLPVTADNVHINRADGALRIDVRYAVRVDLPLYTVDLHFYPAASSR